MRHQPARSHISCRRHLRPRPHLLYIRKTQPAQPSCPQQLSHAHFPEQLTWHNQALRPRLQGPLRQQRCHRLFQRQPRHPTQRMARHHWRQTLALLFPTRRSSHLINPFRCPGNPAALNSHDLPIVGAFVHYLHAVAGFPVKSIWIAAIKAGNFSTCLGITYTNASKYCPSIDETIKGHLT